MQLISWCSFSSALFTVKLRQCVICIIMSQECVLILTASFYYCGSQPWINKPCLKSWKVMGCIQETYIFNIIWIWALCDVKPAKEWLWHYSLGKCHVFLLAFLLSLFLLLSSWWLSKISVLSFQKNCCLENFDYLHLFDFNNTCTGF